MAGCVGVAGSARIGKNCTFGGAAMVLGHLEIADNVHISSGSMVSRSVLEPGQYTGFYPLAKNAEWERARPSCATCPRCARRSARWKNNQN
jgi:UDP-3-O-[3-hydroxymyristoyl] glucosamine N-acyltransferase